MSKLRTKLSQRLREIGVEEHAWPGRTDGFASLTVHGQEFAHFHSACEIDIRLGKDVIKRERLVIRSNSTVHPDRAKASPWYEMEISTDADVGEVIRLVKIAIERIRPKHGARSRRGS